MSTTTQEQGWGVSFAGTTVPFDTKSEARRFIRDAKKDIADQRGGTFKAVLVRIPAPAAGKGASH